jgi:EAL domain-containing protein (putative c-di-GMP-specific phosphodiesterase class I)
MKPTRKRSLKKTEKKLNANLKIDSFKIAATNEAGYAKLNDKQINALYKDLKKAIDCGDFFLVYQPLVEVKTKKMIGMEVLLRWRHAKHGIIPTEKVIVLAEKTGLIHKLGRWVLNAACRQYAAWVKQGYKQYFLSVNLSAVQLDRRELIAFLDKLLKEYNMAAKNLVLELTESAIIKQGRVAHEIMKYLYEIGIKISVDDFGTGYSSLSRLSRLSIYLLKIDKSFIQNIGINEQNEIIIKAIIVLAKNLNLQVLAEGVETEKQRQFLIKFGCPYAQGYYFGRPLMADKMTKFLAQQKNKKY